MKSIYNCLLIGLAALVTSCSASSYYQVYSTAHDSKIVSTDQALTYEDLNCRITYNLWREGGDIGFTFYNKTDQTIHLDMTQCFYIMNGIAYDYYNHQLFSNASYAQSSNTTAVGGLGYLSLFLSQSASSTVSSRQAVAYLEKKVISIPSHTAKIVSEYQINTALYRDCELYRYPRKKEITTAHFSKQNSPFVFSNRLSYRIGEADNLVHLENNFYVSAITNYPKSELITSKPETFCGEESAVTHPVIIGRAPNKFYIKYAKGFESHSFEH